ncbi:hypothetical protein ACOME3_005610 [Neoechinorhynchus agilis]
MDTARSIINVVATIGIESDEDEVETWLEDANTCANEGAPECARRIFALALAKHPKRLDLWLEAAYFERSQNDREALECLLAQAVTHCSDSEVLWLMLAKSKWIANDVTNARKVLANAFSANPNSEEIWLAAVKLESENHEHERARKLLEKAGKSAPTGRVFMKAAKLEWCLGELERALEHVDQGLSKFPLFAKLWMMKGQILQIMEKFTDAGQAFASGIKHCPHCVPLYIL